MFDSKESVILLHLLSPKFPLYNYSTKHVTQIFFLLKKVNYISFQKLYHDYITLTRDFFLFMLNIFPIG